MKCCVLFLTALFACIFDVVLSTNIMQMERFQPKFLLNIRKRSAPSADNQKACFDDFISKKSILLKDFQSEILNCVENAEENFENVINIPVNSTSCSDKDDIEEYYECLKIFEARNVQDERDTKPKEIENDMEKEKQECLQESIKYTKLRDTTLSSQFQQCLFKNAASPLQLPPQNNLNEVKKIYKTLEICSKDNGKGLFHTCLEESFVHKNLLDDVAENAETFYEEIKEFDHTENSCLRHFITQYVHPDFTLKFDLDKCVNQGLDKAAGEEVGDTKVVKDYGKLHKLLNACRVDLNSSSIEMCIYDTLETNEIVTKIAFNSHLMSDSYLQKLREQIYRIFNNEDTCMGYIFDSLQFKGLFMKASVKESMKKCLAERYIVNSTPASAQDVITKLHIIEDSLFLCIRMAIPDAFIRCVNDNILEHQSSLDYIVTSPSFQKEYIKRINRHDKAKGTCFAKIVYGDKVNFFYPFSKCFGGRFFDKSDGVKE